MCWLLIRPLQSQWLPTFVAAFNPAPLFIKGCGYSFPVIYQRLKSADGTQQAIIYCKIPIAINTDNAVVASDHIDTTTQAALSADCFYMCDVLVAAIVGTLAVDQRAGGAYLDTGTAGDAGISPRGPRSATR